MIDTA